ncbi:photosynthetic reaction center cytochrome PufC [uncultured Rhodoblastus sp.]|uniref:photosynthetic reaction center cytochrome PufC n=1 Tax=uncultured Rhodoblastus sp. TaxID=543037 RepID=UPI0025CF4526|nr:photosynthetic reaction center cytochrome PufC [uncultured Rhodoblastus sp.]
MKNIVLIFAGVAAVLLTAAMLLTAGWTSPPIQTVQGGFRGLSIGQLSTKESRHVLQLANTLPDPIDPAEAGGKKATDVYKNVQVLTDLTEAQFNRVMLGLAAWVGGEQGCNYCHNPENLAEDKPYTKIVSRSMLKMTRHINKDWSHVIKSGVTCYTCHRGNPVPANIWFKGAPPKSGGFAATNDGFGHPNAFNGSTGLGEDPFSGYLDAKEPIRVQSTQALPVNFGSSIQDATRSYGLMMSLSTSLGVNCTFCHNSRAFSSWEQASPQRVTAWHGIQMVRDLNINYMNPLLAQWPPNRLGPTGDGPKINCATCHQGASKPLLGVSLAKDWPELGGGAAH